MSTTNTTGTTGGTSTTGTDGGSAKAAARKKKNNNKKNKNKNKGRNSFIGSQPEGSVLFKYVIEDNSNQATQLRDLIEILPVFTTIYPLWPSSIRNMVRLDPDKYLTKRPNAVDEGYATLVATLGADGKADGGKKVVYTDPLKHESAMDHWKLKVKTETDTMEKYKLNGSSLFEIIRGQLDDPLLGKLAHNPDYQKALISQCPIDLLTLLKSACSLGDGSTVNPKLARLQLFRKSVSFQQKPRHKNVSMETSKYKRTFEVHIDSVMEKSGMFAFGTSWWEPLLTANGQSLATFIAMDAVNQNKYNALVKDEIIGMLMIEGCDSEGLKNHLKNEYKINGKIDCYPTTSSKAADLIDSYIEVGGNNNNKNQNTTNNDNEDEQIAGIHATDTEDQDSPIDERPEEEEEPPDDTMIAALAAVEDGGLEDHNYYTPLNVDDIDFDIDFGTEEVAGIHVAVETREESDDESSNNSSSFHLSDHYYCPSGDSDDSSDASSLENSMPGLGERAGDDYSSSDDSSSNGSGFYPLVETILLDSGSTENLTSPASVRSVRDHRPPHVHMTDVQGITIDAFDKQTTIQSMLPPVSCVVIPNNDQDDVNSPVATPVVTSVDPAGRVPMRVQQECFAHVDDIVINKTTLTDVAGEPTRNWTKFTETRRSFPTQVTYSSRTLEVNGAAMALALDLPNAFLHYRPSRPAYVKGRGECGSSGFSPGRELKSSVFLQPITTDINKEDSQPSILPLLDASPILIRLAYAFGNVTVDDTTSTPTHDLRPNLQLTPKAKKVRSVGDTKVHRGSIPLNTLVLDSGATVNLMNNPSFLKNIKETSSAITIHCGGATVSNNQVGEICDELRNLPLPTKDYFFHPTGVANLLSLARVSKEHRVFLDTSIENAFYVFADDGKYIKFALDKNNLYCLHVDDGTSPHVFLTTVGNKSKTYSDLDVRRATLARDIQNRLGLPSDVDLANSLENGTIPECGINRRDIRIAKDIFGPNGNSLEGKTVQRKSKLARSDEVMDLPKSIVDEYTSVTLGIDVMHANGNKFLIAISEHIGYIQTIAIATKSESSFMFGIKKMISQYQLRGFKVVHILGDNAFECCRSTLEAIPYNIKLTTCDKDGHVQIIERAIRFVKDRTRGIRAMMRTLKFKQLPRRFLIEVIYKTVILINSLMRKGGVSAFLSAREIITGKKLRLPPHEIGQFVHASVGETSNVTNEYRTFESLYIGRNDNGSGHYVFDIRTGCRKSVPRVTPLPMPQRVADRINAMGLHDKQPEGIVIGDRNDQQTVDDFNLGLDEDEEDTDDATDASFDPVEDNDIEEAGDHHVEDYVEDEAQFDHFPEENDDESTVESEEVGVPADNEDDDDPMLEELDNNNNEDNDDNNVTDDESNDDYVMEDVEESDDDDNNNNNDNDDNSNSVPRGLDSTLDGSHWNNVIHTHYCMSIISGYGNLEATLTTPQYGFQKGLKVFGEDGYKATIKELDANLIGRNVIDMLPPEAITRDIFTMSLGYLMFLKRKRSGIIKGRGCADGRPQREYITKNESSSPTVANNALFASCLVDAIEKRAVAICDIPGAFLQADWPQDEPCYIRFEGIMVDMICQIEPKYLNNVKHNKARTRKWMVGKLSKAIYGTLLGARLFYDKLRGILEGWNFIINDYDECTFNKMVNGKQLTVQFHVDDLKLSHVDEAVIRSMVADLNGIFGQDGTLLDASYGKVHEYLGMTIDFSEECLVKYTMYDFLEDIIADSPDDMKGTAVTPAHSKLFQVNSECEKLDHKTMDWFHRTVARILFASKRARPDLQTGVAFLCTRVACPDKDDYGKLKKLIEYIRETIYLPLILGWDESGILTWSVDASFAVHMDMRSHTGMALTLGRGALISGSYKQKINTKSSTESELVGVDDGMPFIMWIRLFYIEQFKMYPDDHPMKEVGQKNIILQDNTSTIQLENNGRRSSGKRTRHINIRYFYITDQIKEGKVSVTYCPTLEMVSDYFTKPLQGSLFRTHRNAIMGVSELEVRKYKIAYEDAKKLSRMEG